YVNPKKKIAYNSTVYIRGYMNELGDSSAQINANTQIKIYRVKNGVTLNDSYYNDDENLIDVTNDFRFTDYQNGVGIDFGDLYGDSFVIKVVSKENEAVNKDLIQSVDMYSTSQNGNYNYVNF